MVLKQNVKRALVYGALIASSFGCTPERYYVEEQNSAYVLVDGTTNASRPIADGVAATIDDAVAMVEGQEGSENKLSMQYKGRIWESLDGNSKKGLAVEYFQGMPKREQIMIVSEPLREKASVIAEGAMQEASKAYSGAKGLFENTEIAYTDLTVDMMRGSYSRLKKLLGGGQN